MADVVLVELTCKQKVVVSVHEDHAEQVGVDIVDEVQLVGPDIDTLRACGSQKQLTTYSPSLPPVSPQVQCHVAKPFFQVAPAPISVGLYPRVAVVPGE
eukprot:1195062-Prorocentrum_minimum.AAC.3